MIKQKKSSLRERRERFSLVKLAILISFFLLSNFIHAQSPFAPAPTGKKWEKVNNLSDEFNGGFDGNKWFKPLWNYPEPNFMVNENSGVSGGNLWIKATRGSGNQWFVSSRVQSRAQIKYPMYTECRMKASSISALNTFWMNNGDANNRDEIDICENNAAPTGNPSNGAETPFINASNWWYAENGTNYNGNGRGQTANNHNSTKNLSPGNPLRGVKLDAAYHIIGCYWIDENSFEWWLDGEKVGEVTMNISQVFTRNQNIIWDLWTNPHDGYPAQSDLQNNNINTMYVDWIHTYKLVDDPTNSGPVDPSDLAEGKPAFQSSTYANNTNSFGPERVVDGNGNTFNATNSQQGAWWEVDLGSSQNIGNVKIWNRGDCCQNRLKDFDIKIYDRRGGNVLKTVYVSGQPSANGSNYAVNATGRVVRIQLRGNNYLNMDQVSVFAGTSNNIAVTGVTLSPDNLSLNVGQTGNVTGAVIPSNATVKTMTFTSSNTNVITVTDSGVVTARANGTATITARTTDGGFTDITTVTVGSNNSNNNDLAVGKSAFQSSTHGSFGPEKVVDGDESTFNATSNQQGAWWEVDLGASYNIDQVKIWNRGNCCPERLQNFDIKIYNNRGGAQIKTVYVSGQPSINGSTYNVNATGRVVRIQLRGSNYLSMDQVSVFGTATSNNNNSQAINIEAENFKTTSGTFNDSSIGGPGVGVLRESNIISWVNEGDYVDYEVTIPTSGFYKITYQIASPNTGSTIVFGIPNQNFHTTTVPNTGGWGNYRSLESSSTEYFTAGTHIVRLTAGGGRWTWNLDKFTMELNSSSRNEVTLGISDVTETVKEISIYPVPAQSNVAITGATDGEKEVLVYEMSGNVAIRTKLMIQGGIADLDVSRLSSGIYILSIDGETLRLVVNN